MIVRIFGVRRRMDIIPASECLCVRWGKMVENVGLSGGLLTWKLVWEGLVCD